jgi:hypothetical protein
MNGRPEGYVGDEYVPLYIKKDDRNAFLACLGLGTLYAIRKGVVRPQAGIWTLGRPNVWAPLQDDPEISPEIIAVFSASDELSAIRKLRPDQFEAVIDELIGRLEDVLKSTGDRFWNVCWSLDTDDYVASPNPGA